MKIEDIKIVFIAVFTYISGLLGNLAIPFYILVLTNTIDYLTGIWASACRGERISSERGLRGIAKKVCMWLLVLVGSIVDYMIIALTSTLHIEIGFNNIVAIAVVFWLMANELISILENIHDIGVPMPDFLYNLTKYIKEKTEDTVPVPDDKEE